MTAAQKISRLALGGAEDPTLVVYRTREDTTQDYHIEGLPFGTRGGLLVEHLFPSDGEYTITVTPIFGDNMTPTGFGSVACERLEVLLDGDRLGLMNWNGGGRAAATDCGDRVERAGQIRPGRPGSVLRQRAPDARALHGHRGTAQGWRHVPRHAVRAAPRSRPPLPAVDDPDGTDAGLLVLPARRHDPHRRSVQLREGVRFSQPPQDLRLQARYAPPPNPRARAAS